MFKLRDRFKHNNIITNSNSLETRQINTVIHKYTE